LCFVLARPDVQAFVDINIGRGRECYINFLKVLLTKAGTNFAKYVGDIWHPTFWVLIWYGRSYCLTEDLILRRRTRHDIDILVHKDIGQT
jgi:hypothetical protein